MRRRLQILILYVFHIVIARPLLRWVVGVRYRKRGPLPSGPCLVVSNHNSHLDASILITMFPLSRLWRIHPVAAEDYFSGNWFLRMWAMLLMNAIPIRRRPAKGQDPMAPITERLDAGDTIVFFPEGSRGEAGVVARFRPGIGLLVQSRPGLLVVPVFLSGPERIWPRGNVVPVPLSIDAHVGNARTYTTEDDPRRIAERVRADVLALAPPPPPSPGTRMGRPLRVAICSIDDERRHQVFRHTVERLGKIGRSVGISDAVVESDARGVRETTGPVPAGPSRARLHVLASVFRTRGRYKGGRFVDLIERSWVEEALGLGLDTRFVVGDESPLVDLLAWAESLPGADAGDDLRAAKQLAYLTGRKKIPLPDWWRAVREIPEVWLINAFDLARPPVPDLLVNLWVPAAEVMERLRARGDEIAPYETCARLERLQRAYRPVGAALRRRHRVEVLELDATGLSPESIAERIESACREQVKARDSASSAS